MKKKPRLYRMFLCLLLANTKRLPLFPESALTVRKPSAGPLNIFTGWHIEKIAYIGDINGNIANQDEKFSGYLQAVTELGINPITVHTNKLSWQEGFSSAMKLLQSGGRPTAIVSGSYELTVGILQAVKECSLRIPQDMSLISYDNIPQMADLDIPVTSTGIPVNQIAQNMVDSILSLIEGSQTIPSFQDIEAVIKERSSCAPPVQPGRP